MLVTTMEQGRDLAKCLGERRVALMEGHGCMVDGKSIREVVIDSIYLQVNAGLLLESLRLGDAEHLPPGEIELMSEGQMRPTPRAAPGNTGPTELAEARKPKEDE